MSDTTNRPSINSIVPAATSGEAMAIGSLALGWSVLDATPTFTFLLGRETDEFWKLLVGYLIVTAVAILLAVMAVARTGAGWARAAAGGGMLMSVLGVIFAILTKLFS